MNASAVAPPWLQDEPEIMALLNAVLDRFDKQRGDARHRDVLLTAENFLPSLARGNAAADQVWSLTGELARLGVLRVRLARRSPYDPEWKDAKLAFAPSSEAQLRVWLTREWLEPAMQLWRRAVNKYAAAFPGGCEPLLARRVFIANRSADEIVAAFASIGSMHGPATLRQLSARAFWGNSKVLDDRVELITKLFPHLELRDRAIVVSVHLSERCSGVLFIENQDTYTAACAGHLAAVSGLALVYAAGFRSSAMRIRSTEGALLHYAGPGSAQGAVQFERWWFQGEAPLGPVWFWGDLDFAGMQILKTLRARFGDVQAWQPGYGAMLQYLSECAGHVDPEEAQSDPQLTGCAYADTVLLPAVRARGCVDQESIAFLHVS